MTELPLQEMGMVLEYVKGLKQQLEETERSLAIIHESGILQTIPLQERVNYEYAQASVTSLGTVRQSSARLRETIEQKQLELALLQETIIKAIPEIVRILTWCDSAIL